MIWILHALAAQDLIQAREREIAALQREREIAALRRAGEVNSVRSVRSDVPSFGRIRRPLARVATAIASGADRAAVALDPEASQG